MIKAFASREFVAFVVTGGIAATVNFGSRIIYSQWLDFSVSVIVAYMTGMVTAFLLARYFVFSASTHSTTRSAFFFVLVNVFAVAQTWAISFALAFYLLPSFGVESFVTEIAHAVGVAAPVFTSYLGHKHFSFRAT